MRRVILAAVLIVAVTAGLTCSYVNLIAEAQIAADTVTNVVRNAERRLADAKATLSRSEGQRRDTEKECAEEIAQIDRNIGEQQTRVHQAEGALLMAGAMATVSADSTPTPTVPQPTGTPTEPATAAPTDVPTAAVSPTDAPAAAPPATPGPDLLLPKVINDGTR